MQTVEIFKDAAGEWRYRVKGANGEVMVTSEGYKTVGHAKRGYFDLEIFVRSTSVTTFEILP